MDPKEDITMTKEQYEELVKKYQHLHDELLDIAKERKELEVALQELVDKAAIKQTLEHIVST